MGTFYFFKANLVHIYRGVSDELLLRCSFLPHSRYKGGLVDPQLRTSNDI